jgi:hypothetical protein
MAHLPNVWTEIYYPHFTQTGDVDNIVFICRIFNTFETIINGKNFNFFPTSKSFTHFRSSEVQCRKQTCANSYASKWWHSNAKKREKYEILFRIIKLCFNEHSENNGGNRSIIKKIFY